MFDGGYFDVALIQCGAHRRVADMLGMSLEIDHVIQVRATKDDAGVRRRRSQGHQDLLPRMQPHARGTNRILECSLIQHLSETVFSNRTKVPQGYPARTQNSTTQGAMNSDYVAYAYVRVYCVA